MQGSTNRRGLDTFAPFRADEMVETSFSDRERGKIYAYYPTLGGRLRVAREKFPGLAIRTKIVVGELRVKAVVTCRALAPMMNPSGGPPIAFAEGSGIGTADKEGDGARMLDSLIELAEARSISRALRALGIGTEFTGAEEMTRAGIGAEFAAPTPPAPNQQPQRPVNSATGAPASQAAVPPLLKYKSDLWAKMVGQAGSIDNARNVLAAIIPGRTSMEHFAQHEADLVALVVDAAVLCETPAVVAATKQRLAALIKSQLPFEQWTPNHIVAARNAIRSTPPPAPEPPLQTQPQPGHSAYGDVPPPGF